MSKSETGFRNDKMKKTRYFLLALILVLFLSTHTAYPAGQSLAFKVTDISDRKYEPAVIELLDNAKSSIAISMYGISLGKDTNNPVRLLLNDLLEASDRGVKVTLYINTRFRRNAKKPFIKSPIFQKLEDAGCVIYPLPSKRKLHDKLIIVDKRYVVEGSTNWSVVALRGNFESATLIDSPDLARVKLSRLSNLLIISKEEDEAPNAPAYLENLPKTLIIPDALLLDRQYFPLMVNRNDNRSLDLYLLLLAYSQTTKTKDFFISLEAMGLSLGLPLSWSDTALRRQVIKSLKRLQNQYHLIDVIFFHGKDAAIVIASEAIGGDRGRNVRGSAVSTANDQSQFTIPTTTVIAKSEATRQSLRLKFLLLIKAFLKSKGEDLYAIQKTTLAKRFFISRSTVTAAFNDLREYSSKAGGP